MQLKHFPARATSLLCVILLLGAGIPLLAASTAEAGAWYFDEDWELGSPGWTYSSPSQPVAQQDCTSRFAYRGLCSIEVNAQVRGQAASVSRSFTSLQFTSEPGYVISDYFQAEFPYGKSGCAKVTQFAGGVKATLNLSYGPGGNQVQLILQTPTGSAHTGALTTPNGQQWMYVEATWYRPILKVDLASSKLRVEVRATNGSLLATGPALTLPAGSGASIERIAYESYYYGNGGLTERPAKCNFDWLQVTGPDAPLAPQLATALPGPGLGQVTVSWQAPSDDGGVPVLYYNVYRGDTASTVTTLLGNTTTRSFTDSGMANGESHYYAVRAVNAAGEGPASNAALGVTFNVPTAPRNTAANFGANVGEVRLTWQAPASTGGASITNHRIYRGTSLGNGTFYAQVGNVLSFVDAHVPNGTRYYYNVTAVNFVGEGPSSAEASGLPKPDGATFPASLVLRPDPWWTNQPRELNFSYSVAVSQCAPADACPVAHEWRVYQDGTTLGADGILLANGTNTHTGHAELTTYNVSTVVVPTGLDGTHRLKVAVSPRQGDSLWRVTSLAFQNGLPQPDATCNANPGFYTYIMPGFATANLTGQVYAKNYSYKLNGVVGPHKATFVDGCLANGPTGPGDGVFEIGYGGLLLDRPLRGSLLQLPDSTGNFVSFVMGTDGNNNGIIGDSPLDCFEGPYLFRANVTCLPDANGKVVVILLPPEDGLKPLPAASDPIWGRGPLCTPVRDICVHYCDGPCAGGGDPADGIAYQADKGRNGLGDAWENNVNKTAYRSGRQIDAILGPLQDQEFLTPCNPIDCVGQSLGDGLENVDEFRWQTYPIGPLHACFVGVGCVDLLLNARDFDGDNWEDGDEHAYWNNKDNDLLLDNPSWAAIMAAPFDPDATRSFDQRPDANGTPHDPDGKGTLHDPDNDNDGLLDGDEYKIWGTYPEFPDSDCDANLSVCSPPGPSYWSVHQGEPGTGDKINDSAEKTYWLGIGPGGITRDWDRDGIANNLLDPDADGDEVLDGEELPLATGGVCAGECTNASLPDTDGDGLLDGTDLELLPGDPRVSIFVGHNLAYIRTTGGNYVFFGEDRAPTPTRRDVKDSDGDCLPDGWEVRYGLDPWDDADANTTTDGDDLTALAEYNYGRDPLACDHALRWSGVDPTLSDTDLDGLSDSDEAPYSGDPREPDTDMDGLRDGEEVYLHFTLVNQSDSDGDKLSDYQEAVKYANRGVSPLNANTDGSGNGTNDDTLTDYREIVQYGTNPGNWDTDNDGDADGRDERPLAYDEPPRPRPPPTDVVVNLSYDAYVVFRTTGYIDLYLRETHGNEADINTVEMQVNLTGTVRGTTGSNVSFSQEAARLDDGATWGARFALPRHMSTSTSQDYRLIVITNDGAARIFDGLETQQRMGLVNWTAESDAPANGNEWENLDSHFSDPEAEGPGTSSASPSAGGDQLAALPWSMNASALFEHFGGFSVYRLKPGAVLAGDAGSVHNLSAVGIIRPMAVPLDENGTAIVGTNFSVTVYENAFEEVPLDELGVLQTTAAGGRFGFRTPHFVWTGLSKVPITGPILLPRDPAQELQEFGYSFVFGQDDPRAKGSWMGDFIAGLVVYGDARDLTLGAVEGNHWKMGLGGVGLLLTVYPPADAPYAALKGEIKLLAKTPAGKDLAVRLMKDYGVAFKNGDVSPKTILRTAEVARYAAANPDKIPEIFRILDAVGEVNGGAVLRGLSGELDNVVSVSVDLVRVLGDEGAKEAIRYLSQASDLYPSGGAEALAEVSQLAKIVRENAIAEGRHVDTAANFVKDIVDLRNAPNANAWWHDRAKTNIRAPSNDGWYGYVFEAEQAARVHREGEGVLSGLDEILDDVVVGVNGVELPPRDVQVDFFRKATDGKRILTDSKSGTVTRSTENNRIQMEAQAAAVRQYEGSKNLKREIHWIVEGRVTQPLAQHAADLQGNYGVTLKFFDRQGNQIMDYFPE